MIISETNCKTVEFISTKLETQCNKCQKFEHTTNTCNALAKCQFCANMHNTHNHKCDMCESNQICPHIELKCANCDKKHHAKDASREVYFALKSNEKISIYCMTSISNSSNLEMQKNCEFCNTIAIDKQMLCKQY